MAAFIPEEAVLALVREAGQHLARFYAKQVAVQQKADCTPVTEADLFVSQFMTERLRALTPEIPVLSEEHCDVPLEERQTWQRYWLLDPLDGTQQFIDRTDQFSVMLALMEQNQPVLGMIYAPILDKLYVAKRNHGAFLYTQGKQIALSVRESARLDANQLCIAVGTSSQQAIIDAVQAPFAPSFLVYGSSSLKAGLVAEGIADCYVRLGKTGEWDTAAAQILLEEAGGKIVDTHFQPLTYNQRTHFINPDFIMLSNASRDWRQIFDFAPKGREALPSAS